MTWFVSTTTSMGDGLAGLAGVDADGFGVTTPPVPDEPEPGLLSGVRRRGGLSSMTHANSDADSATHAMPANTEEDMCEG